MINTQTKVISLDLWNTLIKSNPEFKKVRAELVSKYCDKTPAEVSAVFDGIKKSYDALTRRTGVQFTVNDMYNVVAKELGGINGIRPSELKKECDMHFLKNPPVLYDTGTLDALKYLSSRYDTYLISNTMMVDGNVLTVLLSILGIERLFNGSIFSDQVGHAKPSTQIFAAAHMRMSCRAEHVLHIGDDEITDVKGANDYGFKSVLVNNKTYTEQSNFLQYTTVTLTDVVNALEHYNTNEDKKIFTT